MSWMQTYSGVAFDLRSPRAEDVRFEDIAHALARINRYNGHTTQSYSVAEHCCHVADALDRDYPGERYLPLAGLLHDASEAYVGDLIYPLWQALSPAAAAEIKGLLAGVDVAIREALHLPPEVDIHDPRVRDADRRILLDEREALMRSPPPRPWGVDGMKPLGASIQAWKDHEAKRAFCLRWGLYAHRAGVTP